MSNNNWGKTKIYTNELKYEYVNETDLYNKPTTKRQMTKEELKIYLNELEVKNKWKQYKAF